MATDSERLVAAWIAEAEPRLRESLPAADAEPLIARLRSASWLELLAFAASRRSGVVSALERQTLEHLASRHGIAPAHVEEALELLRSGRLGDDLAGVTAVSSRSLGSLPGAVRELLRHPDAAADLIPAIFRDLLELPADLGAIVPDGLRDLFRGRPPARDPEQRGRLLEHTLRELYAIAPLDVVRRWAHEVSGRESAQLAMIAYASTHGVELRGDDIEAARAALADGDLAPLLLAAFGYFRRQAPERLEGFFAA